MRLRPAYYYTANLHQYLHETKLDVATFRIIHEMIEHYASEYNRHKKETDNISVAHGFQKEIQQLIDATTKEPLLKKVKCAKGCSFCCHYHIDITDDEAQLLVEHAKEENIPIDIERLKKQKDITVENWKTLKHVDKKCVFLDDNGCCKVYEYRPVSCRTLLVVSDPNHCDNNNPEDQVQKLSITEVNVIASGILNATKSGSMANLLLEKIQPNE